MSARIQPPWPPDRSPTAAEWVDWFLTNSRAGQKEIAAMALSNLADIHRCIQSRSCWIDR